MDYNATTPLDREVLAAIHRSLKFAWGNPSSSHQAGKMSEVEIINNVIAFFVENLVMCRYFVLLQLLEKTSFAKH